MFLFPSWTFRQLSILYMINTSADQGGQYQKTGRLCWPVKALSLLLSLSLGSTTCRRCASFQITIMIVICQVLITFLLLIAQIYSDLDLEYFEKALDWVLAREEVCGDNGAGLQGISQVELSKCISV